jgi:hypothetical protein
MAESNRTPDPLPETFDSFEEMAEFWDTHDITDYEEYLTPVEMEVVSSPKHEYVITLSDTLDTKLRQIQKKEGVSLTTLVNLWVQEKLQQSSES